MASFIVVLLLAAGFFHNYSSSLSKTPLRGVAANSDSNKDAWQVRAKPDAIPKWLKRMIHEFEAAGSENTTARVVRYRYRNGVVYFLEAKCCDIFNILYDSAGKQICSTGGFTGRGDGKCEDFYSKRQHEKVIWEDEKKH